MPFENWELEKARFQDGVGMKKHSRGCVPKFAPASLTQTLRPPTSLPFCAGWCREMWTNRALTTPFSGRLSPANEHALFSKLGWVFSTFKTQCKLFLLFLMSQPGKFNQTFPWANTRCWIQLSLECLKLSCICLFECLFHLVDYEFECLVPHLVAAQFTQNPHPPAKRQS